MPLLRSLYLLLLISALYPCSFLVTNFDSFSVPDISLSLAVSYITTLAGFGIAYAITRERKRSVIICLWFTIAFWGYSFLSTWMFHQVAEWYGLRDATARSKRYCLVIGLAAAAAAGYFSYRKLVAPLSGVRGQKLMAIFLHCFIGICAFQLVCATVASRLASISEKTLATTEVRTEGEKPDIYYIILDGYGRTDILKNIYHYDNSWFTSFLESEGFYVSHNAHSNYMQTPISLSSSLNMDYVSTFLDMKKLHRSSSRLPMNLRIRHSDVRAFLHNQGYKLIAIDSGFDVTQIYDADQRILPRQSFLSQGDTDFLLSMISDSALPQFSAGFDRDSRGNPNFFMNNLTDRFSFTSYGARMVWRFQELKRLIPTNGPKFVWAHFTSPHPDFVFNEHDPLDKYVTKNVNDPFRIGYDGEGYTLRNKFRIHTYIRRYPQQLGYVSRQMEDFVKTIMKERPNSIILIQGDHGPGALLDTTNVDHSNLPERFSILDAFYFPNKDYSRLTQDMSPVNSFRTVFNTYFGTNFAMLPYHAYFCDWDYPYDQLDVTDRLLHRTPPDLWPAPENENIPVPVPEKLKPQAKNP